MYRGCHDEEQPSLSTPHCTDLSLCAFLSPEKNAESHLVTSTSFSLVPHDTYCMGLMDNSLLVKYINSEGGLSLKEIRLHQGSQPL